MHISIQMVKLADKKFIDIFQTTCTQCTHISFILSNFDGPLPGLGSELAG